MTLRLQTISSILIAPLTHQGLAMRTPNVAQHQRHLGAGILLLAGLCAGCIPVRDPMDEQKVVQVGDTYKVMTLRESAAEDERQRQEAAQRERERAAQSAAYEVQRKREQQELAAAVAKHIQEDEALGYKHMSITDFQLDNKTMRPGAKLALSGIYQRSGQLETLKEGWLPNAPKAFLLTDSATRETRARLLRCIGYCPLTVVGHIAKCSLTWAGNEVSNKVCVVVERTWESTNSR